MVVTKRQVNGPRTGANKENVPTKTLKNVRPQVSSPPKQLLLPMSPLPSPPVIPVDEELSREEQVGHVFQLLRARGEEASTEVRQRVEAKKGVFAKGLYFDVTVLAEALEKWDRYNAEMIASTDTSARPSTKRKSPADLGRDADSVAETSSALGKSTRRSFGSIDISSIESDSPRPSKSLRSSSPEASASLKGYSLRDRLALRAARSNSNVEAMTIPEIATPCRGVSPPSLAPGVVQQDDRTVTTSQNSEAEDDLEAIGVSSSTLDIGAVGFQPPTAAPGKPKGRSRAAVTAIATSFTKPTPSSSSTSGKGAKGTSRRASLANSNISGYDDASYNRNPSSNKSMIATKADNQLQVTDEIIACKEKQVNNNINSSFDIHNSDRAGNNNTEKTRENTKAIKKLNPPAKPSSMDKNTIKNLDKTKPTQNNQTENSGTAKLQLTEPTPSVSSGNSGKSVRELKEQLAAAGVAPPTGCIEKAELQKLLESLERLRKRPLRDLQAACVAAGGSSFGSIDECARFLLEPSRSAVTSTSTETSKETVAPKDEKKEVHTAPESSSNSAASTQAEAAREVVRILKLRREDFSSASLWGFAVLDIPSTAVQDVAAAQRGYRTLMRKLHPDKAGGASPGLAQAAELAREARDAIEKGLSREEPPNAPRNLQYTVLNATPGSRRIQLQWSPPPVRESAPVRRYLVATLDPSYGRPLTAAVLEPDYSEELHRFVSVEELTSYMLAEEELQKMPSFWSQPCATVQVAAANEKGQSPWAVIQIRLSQSALASAANGAKKKPDQKGGTPGAPAPDDVIDDKAFNREIARRHGGTLRTWLESQRKASLASWLRYVHWPALGSKEDLVSRIIFVREGSSNP